MSGLFDQLPQPGHLAGQPFGVGVGTIGVRRESVPGRGTTIYLSVPLHAVGTEGMAVVE